MARKDPVHEAAQKYSNPNTSSASNTNSANCVDCSGSGKFWIIPESYQIIKYVTLFGETKYKGPALTGKSMFPFGKFFWRKHIEIIDARNQIANLAPINDFKSNDGVTVCADLYAQYTITDVHKYVLNQINFNEKLQENIKSIMQQHFRNHSSDEISMGEISIDAVGRDKFRSLEEQYGIRITNFSAAKLKLPEIDDDKTKRKEMQLRMETEKAQLDLQKAQLQLQRDIQTFMAATDSLVRTETLSNIKSQISNFPKQHQAALMSKIYEIEKLANSNANITYISGAENFNQNSNSRSK